MRSTMFFLIILTTLNLNALKSINIETDIELDSVFFDFDIKGNIYIPSADCSQIVVFSDNTVVNKIKLYEEFKLNYFKKIKFLFLIK